MASWLIQRRLARLSSRLRALRGELATIDEQIPYFADDADDLAVRALVSEAPGAASHESRDAQKHADTMRRHRARIVSDIAGLEARQDRLLDQLTQRAR